MERKIGEIFDYKGITLKTVENTSSECKGCYFNTSPSCDKEIDVTGHCVNGRTDRKVVKFVKIMEKPEIKAGMLVESCDCVYMVIPNEKGNLIGISSNTSWCSNFENLSITKIGYPKFYFGDHKWKIEKILWEKPKEIVVTIDEIAKKFGVSPENLKIKK